MAEFKLRLLLIAKDQLSGIAGKAEDAMGKLESRLNGARLDADRVGKAGKGMMKVGAALLVVSGATVKAFATLEGSMARLENASSTINGPHRMLADLKKQVVDLGNRYPGNTAMFTNLAEAMLKAGMPLETLTAGALKAAGALQVMYGLDPATAGKQFVQMGNAMGIAGKDAGQFADMIQRLSYASGMTLDEISTAMPYMGEKLKALGLQGIDKAKQLMVVMGALKKGGVEGSMVGTAFEEFLKNTASIGAKERHIRGGLRVETFAELKTDGIKLDFFDEKGQFRGMYQAIAELDKLKALSQEKRIMVMEQLFGSTGARMAAVDLGAVRAMADRMLVQEDLNKRLERITATLGGRWEASKGTFINLLATIGERLAPPMGAFLDKVNGLLSASQKWADAHPRLVGSLGILAASLGTLLAVGGGTLWLFAKLVTAWTMVAKVFSGASVIFGALPTTLWGAVTATWAWTVALMANPITGIVLGVVALGAAAFMLIKHWNKVKTWMVGFWAWFKGMLNKSPDWLLAIVAPWTLLIKHWEGVKAAALATWGFIKGVLLGVLDGLKGPISGAQGAVGKLWGAFKDLGAVLTDAVRSALESIGAVFKTLWAALLPILSAIGRAFGAVWRALSPILSTMALNALKAFGVIALLPMATSIGIVVGALWLMGKALTYALKAVTWLIEKVTAGIKWFTEFASVAANAGVGLVKAFAGGIINGATHAVEAIKKVVAKVRQFLPFSPAKEGPLNDIHRVRLVETIADLMTGFKSTPAAPAPILPTRAQERRVQVVVRIDDRGAAPGTRQEIETALRSVVSSLKRELAPGMAFARSV